MRSSIRLAIASAMTIQLINGVVCFADTVSVPASTPSTAPASTPAAPVQHVLDLSSTALGAAPAQLLGNGSVTIQVGGAQKTIGVGAQLTAAERVAVYQVAKTGQQSIVIGAQGNAVGGSLNIGSQFAQHLSGLVVPQNVSVVDRVNTLNLTGNLVNNGSIFAVGANATNVAINASNIFNNAGAVISNMAPASLGLTGLPAVGNLALLAQNTIQNAGTISSSGNLSMIAGNAINNVLSSTNAAAMALPAMHAIGNLNLSAPQLANMGSIVAQTGVINATTSSLINAGIMQSLTSGISIQGLPGSKLLVNNTMGQIIAAGMLSIGTVGICTTEPTQTALTVRNGVLSGSAINFSSPGSFTDVSVDRLDGPVSASGYGAAIASKSGNLNISSLRFDGDPIISLHGGGTLTLNNFDSSGTPTDFIALSDGSIDADPTATAINTYGGVITLSAGYDFTTTNLSPDNCTNCAGNYTLSRTPTGFTGNIDLAGVALASSGNTQSDGGNITIQATDRVQTGAISTNGGNGYSSYSLSTPTPAGNAGNIVIDSGRGTITGDISAVGGSGAQGYSSFYYSQSGGAGGNGGSVALTAADSVSTGAVLLQGGFGGMGSNNYYNYSRNYGNTASGGAGGNAGNLLSVNAGNAISMGSISGMGGSGGAGGRNFGYSYNYYPSSPGSGGAGGTGANVSIQAGGNVAVGNVYTNGGGGATGAYDYSYMGTGGAGGGGGNAGGVNISGGSLALGSLNASGGSGGYTGRGYGYGYFPYRTNAGDGGNGNTVTLRSDASVSSGAINTGGGTGGSVNCCSYDFRSRPGSGGSAGAVDISAGTAITLDSINATGGSAGYGSYYYYGYASGGRGDNVIVRGGLASAGNVQMNGNIGTWTNGALSGGVVSVQSSNGDVALQSVVAGDRSISVTASRDITTASGSTITGSDMYMSAGRSIAVNGNVTSQGGRVDLLANGTTTIDAGSNVSAGWIQFASQTPGAGNVTVVNNGTISATNIVAFTGGPSSSVALHGTGSVFGGEYIAFGNVDPITLSIIDSVSMAPTNSFSSYLVSASQGSAMGNSIKVTAAPPSVPASTYPVAPNAAPVVAQLTPKLVVPNLSAVTFQINQNALVATDKTPITPPALPAQESQSSNTSFALHAEAAEHLVTRVNDQFGSVYLLEDGVKLQDIDGDNTKMVLNNGQIFCAPNRDIVVNTACGDVSIKKGAVAVVIVKGNAVSVYNLADKSADDITVTSGEHSIALSPPGTQLSMSTNVKADLYEINPRADLAIRQPRAGSLGDGVKAFLCEFSMISAMSQFRSLSQLRSSGDTREHQLSEVVLRNAAIRSLTAHGTAPYQTDRSQTASE